MANSILIVDDEQGIREALSSILADEGYESVAVSSGEECLSLLEARSIDLVLLDVWLDGIDGLDTLERIRKNGVDAMVVMISGHASIETAVRATKLGAFDFVEKPLSLEKVILVIKNALEVHRLAQENRQLREEIGGRTQLQGDTVPMRALRQQIALTAPTNGRVLIYGESGTGKELVARALHAPTLREDLFCRLNGLPFTLPPLRGRIEDVPILARYFMLEFAAAYGRKPKEVTDAAIGVMLRYQWPGNVRELRNLIERLMIVVPQDKIEPLHLPPELFRASSRMAQQPNATLHEARSAYEREFILRKLEENQWHMTRTAEALGLEPSHLS